MSKQDEFYHWWSGLTQEQRINCWYDLDAMAHGEVVASLRAQLTTQSAALTQALERAERAERALAVCARAGCPSAAGFRDSASAGAVMTYPALCDCGRGKGTPHATGCAALTDSASQVKP